MSQSSALRKLEITLSSAVRDGKPTLPSGPVLLKAMNLEACASNLIAFYALLNKAESEIRSLRNKPNLERYLQTLERLNNHFATEDLWGGGWHIFADFIVKGDVLNTLDSLADFFHQGNELVLLEEDFLGSLDEKFNSLLAEISVSQIPRKLKTFLTKQIWNIQRAIYEYQIDGTEGLKRAAQAAFSDLVIADSKIVGEDKEAPIFRKVQSFLLSLVVYLAPTPYDIIGAVPDIQEYWQPKIEELIRGHERIEKIVCATPTIQAAAEKAANVFGRDSQQAISGSKELPALTAAKEESSVNAINNSDSETCASSSIKHSPSLPPE
jgi:hypothetical protein